MGTCTFIVAFTHRSRTHLIRSNSLLAGRASGGLLQSVSSRKCHRNAESKVTHALIRLEPVARGGAHIFRPVIP